jgi:4-amino-4-deoxy-L-arabinose transferase-like glycosyltransferase
MLNHLVAVAFSAGYCILLYCLVLRYPSIRVPILLGGGIRLLLAWPIGLRMITIQGASNDARVFERVAREWSQLPWAELMQHFDPSRSYIISFFGAILFKIFSDSPVMLNIINAAASVYLIVLAYRLAFRLFGERRGRVAAWIIALFPFAILYGSVYRREVFGSVLFMLGLLRMTDWVATKRTLPLIAALAFIAAAAMFHGGYLTGIVGIGAVAFRNALRRTPGEGRRGGVNRIISSIFGLLLLVTSFAALVASGFSVNKIGEIGEVNVAEAVETRVAGRVSDGGSSYPDFLRGEDPFAKPYVIPGRVVYFLLSPFPWDIKEPNHLLGVFAAFLSSYMVISIWKARRRIWANPQAAAVFIVVFVTVVVFGISVDNIGTSIRHRTKFVYALVALCAVPVFPRIVLARPRWRGVAPRASIGPAIPPETRGGSNLVARPRAP